MKVNMIDDRGRTVVVEVNITILTINGKEVNYQDDGVIEYLCRNRIQKEITDAQFTSFKRFLAAGATLLELFNNYFLFETHDKRRMAVHISQKGQSDVYMMEPFSRINSDGEAF